jgi:hypothetical protein
MIERKKERKKEKESKQEERKKGKKKRKERTSPGCVLSHPWERIEASLKEQLPKIASFTLLALNTCN